MKPAPLPATPDLMTLLCLIGDAMRAAGPSGVWVQLLMIGTMCPRIGGLLEAWLVMEEHRAASDGDWAEAEEGESGWICRQGPVWRWRQVTRFGSVLVIPVRLVTAFENACLRAWSEVWRPVWSQGVSVRALIFWPG